MADFLLNYARPDLDVNAQLASELEPGERIIWAERPNPKAFARGSWALVVFGIPWTAFAFFWTGAALWGVSKASSSMGPAGYFTYLFPLFGVPFICIGVGMLTSPYWARRAAARSAYAITDRRAIVRTATFWGQLRGTTSVQSFHPDRLTSLTRTERSDGSGDLIFETFTTRAGSGHTTVRRGFVGLNNVRQVEDLLRKTLLTQTRSL